MNTIHMFEADSEEITEGNLVRTKCGKRLVFRSHGSKPQGGILCQSCRSPVRVVGGPPFLFAVLELEDGVLAQKASA